MPSESTASADKRSAATHTGLKIFGYFVILLMAITIIYTFYIMIINWVHIGV